jgi:hypothetical protein
MDVVAPKRDRARERLCELDLVMLAVMINVNDGPFTALRQDAGFALDGVPDSHDAEFRDPECIVHYSANPSPLCVTMADTLKAILRQAASWWTGSSQRCGILHRPNFGCRVTCTWCVVPTGCWCDMTPREMRSRK